MTADGESKRPEGKGERSGNLIGGLVLIAIGLWFLADNFGFQTFRLRAIWPIFPTLAGVGFILSYLTGREKDEGVLIPGVICLLLGPFFFLFTAGPLDWDDMGALWPVFPLIAGVAFLVTWLAGRCRDPGYLWSGLPALGVGAIGLLFTLGPFRFRTIVQGWPLVLVGVGVWLLVREWLRMRRDTPAGDPPV
jgi:hypothetical protein